MQGTEKWQMEVLAKTKLESENHASILRNINYTL